MTVQTPAERRAYYNEFDPGAAAWLRNLISMGLIAEGDVDERSILDVRPDDLRGYTQCHFFAGIGGWSASLRLAGWPDDRPVWTGSPPCQPFSVAGKGLSRDDPRHLAPHFVSLVRACRPAVLFGEQVASADVFGKAPKRAGKGAAIAPDWAWLDDLSDRLEAAHYAVGASDIPAAGVDAPNIRQRTFFGAVDGLADASGSGQHWWDRAAGGHRSEAVHDCRFGGLASPDSRERHGVADGEGRQPDREASGRQQGYGQPAAGGQLCRLDHSGSIGPGPWRDRDHRRDERFQPSAARADDRPDAPESLWSDPDWLFCRDALWRPVEPGSFPLAHGLPVGMGVLSPEDRRLAGLAGLSQQSLRAAKEYRKEALRGYGNAINPHAAAQFIRAFDAVLSARAHLETAA